MWFYLPVKKLAKKGKSYLYCQKCDYVRYLNGDEQNQPELEAKESQKQRTGQSEEVIQTTKSSADSDEKEIEEFLDYLRLEKNASPHTVAAYSRDLQQLALYLKDNGYNWRTADTLACAAFWPNFISAKLKKAPWCENWPP